MWHKSFRMSVALLVGGILLILTLPSGALASKPITPLQVDVWCNKGGQGPGMPGGTFQVGEVPVIYFTVNRPCQVQLVLNGPGGSNTWSVFADYGQTYMKQLGVAEDSDAGTWQVMLQASTGQEFAQDVVTFTVAGSPPPPSPPTIPSTPTPQPSQTPEPEATPEEQPSTISTPPDSSDIIGTSTINSDTATEMAALMALNMARGDMEVDLKLDANGDGKVTTEDAEMILKWSVTGYAGDMSSAQQEIIDAFGYPEQFNVSYLLDSQTEFNAMVRSEIWMYPQHQKQVTFVGGDIYATDDLPPLENPGASCSKLKPQDVNYFTTPEQIAEIVGGKVAKTDFIPELFEENNVESYLGKDVMFIIADGNLVHLQTFCTTPDGISINIEGVRNLFAEASPFTAHPIQARGNLWRAIKKGAQFVVKLPEKVTSAILPRKLAPFAAAILEMKMGNLNAWRAAVQINNLAQIDDGVREARNTYTQEANRLNEQIEVLRAERDRLYGTGPTELGLTPREWMDRKHALDQLIPQLEQAHTGLNRAANNLNRNRIANIAFSNVIKQTLGNVKNVALNEVRNQIANLNHGNVILAFLTTQQGIMNGSGLIDLWVDGDIRRALGNKGSDTALVDRIRQSLLDQIKLDSANVRRNWQQVLENTIAQITSGSDKASGAVPEVPKFAEPPFKLADGKFVSGSGSQAENIDEFANLFLQEILPRISIYVDDEGEIVFHQRVPLDITAGTGQIKGSAGVFMEGRQFINDTFTGEFDIVANTTAQQGENSMPLDFKYSGQFTSPPLSKDSEGNIHPITLTFTGPIRSQAIVQIYAAILEHIREAFSFGGSADGSTGGETQAIPEDTVCTSYTCKVTYTVQEIEGDSEYNSDVEPD